MRQKKRIAQIAPFSMQRALTNRQAKPEYAAATGAHGPQFPKTTASSLTRADIVAMAAQLDELNVPKEGRQVILSPLHFHLFKRKWLMSERKRKRIERNRGRGRFI